MNNFIARWNFVRSETIEILNALTDEQLQFAPKGAEWQPLYYQFGCMGRTQLVYAAAAQSGKMDFSLFSSSVFPDKHDNQSVTQVLEFLRNCNETWLNALQENEIGVKWPNDQQPIELHISNLAEHERLHHGQLISYFTLARIELPPNFKRNWAL